MKSLLLLLVATIYLYSSTPKVKASFNCALAKTDVEKLICSDINLGEMDIELSDIYHSIKTPLPEEVKKHLYRSQIKWIFKKRAKCLGVICLMDSYRERTKKLRYLKQKLVGAKDSNYKMIALINRFDIAVVKPKKVVVVRASDKDIGFGSVAKEFGVIKKSLKSYKSKTYPLNEISSEGGEVTIYRTIKGEIRFAKVTLFGETYKDIEEFYYKKSKLVYGETQYFSYNAPMYMPTFDSTLTKKLVSRYYYKNSKLVKWIKGSRTLEIVTDKTALDNKSDYIKDISDKVLKF